MINKIYQICYFFADYLYDAYRYILHSTTISINSFSRLEGRLMANAHVVEKGLSLEKPRPKFGLDTIKTLLTLVQKYIKDNHPTNNFAFQSANQALLDYLEFHRIKGVSLGVVEKKINDLSNGRTNKVGGSTMILNTEKYFKSDSFADVLTKRRSVRNFLSAPVSLKKIENAVRLALNSPSVCNRQSWRVYTLNRKHLVDQVLDLQRGNRGFRNKIKTLLVVTSDLSSFQGFNERNQCFIDGGLFSMSLLLSLHSVKLASCPMNWSYNFDEDIKIRKVLKIRKSETIIMIIAVGNMPPRVKVPRSLKKSVPETLKILN